MKPKAISYSIFNANDSHEFYSYLRGLWLNMRLNRLIYPTWTTVVIADDSVINSRFSPLIKWMEQQADVKVYPFPYGQPLCRAMLQRMAVPFISGKDGWEYSHVLFRDTDSIPTYREAQAVAVWLREGTTVHCITDSISHTIPLMGGMVGVRVDDFSFRMKANSLSELLAKSKLGLDYNIKGTDQTFMNEVIWPEVSKHDSPSYTAHWIKGLVGGNQNSQYNYIEDIVLEDVPLEYKELNLCCGHIGSAGYYSDELVRFLFKHDIYREQYLDIERQYPQLFYWNV
jgi:hypothetical protein